MYDGHQALFRASKCVLFRAFLSVSACCLEPSGSLIFPCGEGNTDISLRSVVFSVYSPVSAFESHDTNEYSHSMTQFSSSLHIVLTIVLPKLHYYISSHISDSFFLPLGQRLWCASNGS